MDGIVIFPQTVTDRFRQIIHNVWHLPSPSQKRCHKCVNVIKRGRSTRPALPNCASVFITCHQFQFFRETWHPYAQTKFDFTVSQAQQIVYMYPITSVKVWSGKHVQKLPNSVYNDIGVPCKWLSIKITLIYAVVLTLLFHQFFTVHIRMLMIQQ